MLYFFTRKTRKAKKKKKQSTLYRFEATTGSQSQSRQPKWRAWEPTLCHPPISPQTHPLLRQSSTTTATFTAGATDTSTNNDDSDHQSRHRGLLCCEEIDSRFHGLGCVDVDEAVRSRGGARVGWVSGCWCCVGADQDSAPSVAGTGQHEGCGGRTRSCLAKRNKVILSFKRKLRTWLV